MSSFYMRMDIGEHPACVSTEKQKPSMYRVSEEPDTPRTRGRPVAGDDALDTDFLRRAEDLALVADDPGVDGADEDVDTLQVLLQLLVVVGQLPDSDLHPRRLQLHGCGL